MALTAAFPLSNTALAMLPDARLVTIVTQLKNEVTSIEGWITDLEAAQAITVPASITWQVSAAHIGMFNDVRLITVIQNAQAWCEAFHTYLNSLVDFAALPWTIADADVAMFPSTELVDICDWLKTELNACKTRYNAFTVAGALAGTLDDLTTTATGTVTGP